LLVKTTTFDFGGAGGDFLIFCCPLFPFPVPPIYVGISALTGRGSVSASILQESLLFSVARHNMAEKRGAGFVLSTEILNQQKIKIIK
jgi:hypothetical protein